MLRSAVVFKGISFIQSLDFKMVNKPLKELLQTVINELLNEQKSNHNNELAALCELFLKDADN